MERYNFGREDQYDEQEENKSYGKRKSVESSYFSGNKAEDDDLKLSKSDNKSELMDMASAEVFFSDVNSSSRVVRYYSAPPGHHHHTHSHPMHYSQSKSVFEKELEILYFSGLSKES